MVMIPSFGAHLPAHATLAVSPPYALVVESRRPGRRAGRRSLAAWAVRAEPRSRDAQPELGRASAVATNGLPDRSRRSARWLRRLCSRQEGWQVADGYVRNLRSGYDDRVGV